MVHRAVRKIKAKKYDKELDQVEQLEQEVRELKSINRSLLKQLKKLSKGINREEYDEALESIGHGKKEEGKLRPRECPECSRIGLTEIIIAGRIFYRCSICQYKSGVIRQK